MEADPIGEANAPGRGEVVAAAAAALLRKSVRALRRLLAIVKAMKTHARHISR